MKSQPETHWPIIPPRVSLGIVFSFSFFFNYVYANFHSAERPYLGARPDSDCGTLLPVV